MTKLEKIGTLLLCVLTIQIIAFSNVNAQSNMFALLDTNSDGYISINEALADDTLLASFNRIDTDEDGKISMAELAAADYSGDDATHGNTP